MTDKWLEYKAKGLADGTIVRRVVCAANRHPTDHKTIFCSPRHFDPLMCQEMFARGYDRVTTGIVIKWEQGFIDQWGDFMDRTEALAVARASGQSTRGDIHLSNKKYLYSEDLY
jgi:hypothetical protein